MKRFFTPLISTILSVILLVAGLSMLIWNIGEWYRNRLICVGHNRIAEIGECDYDGYCGVRFYDGSYGEASHPVLDQEVCTYNEFRWRSQSSN